MTVLFSIGYRNRIISRDEVVTDGIIEDVMMACDVRRK
jgi:hypothetical protein